MGPRALAAAAVVFALAGCARVRVTEASLFVRQDAVSTPGRLGLRADDFFFAAGDGTRINAWYLKSPGARATVLFFGGNAFALADSKGFAEAITGLHVNLFMMDYRGYGRSGGTPSVASFKSDALRAYDVLRERFEPDPARIIVHGHSLGTFAATLVASERPVGALVLQNPATDGRETLHYMVPWYLRPFVRFQADPALLADSNLERIRGVRVPTLIAGGSRDRVTSPKMARALFAASGAGIKRFLIVQGAGHNDVWPDPRFQSAYEWLITQVARAR